MTRTFNFNYLQDGPYVSRHIRNRLLTSSVTDAFGTTPLAENYYDVYMIQPLGNGMYADMNLIDRTGLRLRDAEYTTAFAYRGNVSLSVSEPGAVNRFGYEVTGVLANRWDAMARKFTTAQTSATAYTLPTELRPNDNANLQVDVAYNTAFQVRSVTGANKESSETSYDGYGRPSSSKSKDGAITTYTYTYVDVYNPTGTFNTQTATVGNRWKRTTFDGFGRPIKVLTGYGLGELNEVKVSQVDTEYEACACSAIGKLKRVSLPYLNVAQRKWTTYTYDGRGRTLSVVGPDNSSTTRYSYAGNRTTVTDPKLKAKYFYNDASGNLIQVTEPSSTGGAMTVHTYYTYDGLNRLRKVEMARNGTTQTRTFTYTGLKLTSASNPENGTVSYEYNLDMRVSARTDAKNQRTTYAYDDYGRLTQVGYRTLVNGQWVENTGQRVQHFYDTNPVDSTWSAYGWGRRTASYFGTDSRFQYLYKYNQAGRLTGKQLRISGSTDSIGASYQYDNEGRRTQMTHPDGTVYNYAFDTMGRLSTMSLNSGGGVVAQVNGYGVAGQITSMTYDGVVETRAYNESLQMTRLTARRTEIPGQTRTLMDMEYRFSTSQNNENNGRIYSSKDWVSGEDISYSYDELNRLVAAGTEAYVYDGFGNMTSKAGVAISINAATNHAATGYDANGAYIGGYLQGLQAYEYQYNGENRLTRDNNLGRDYEYDPYGKRIMAKLNASTEHVYFYEGTGGRRLATYGRNRSDGTLGHLSSDLTFAGKLIRQYHTVVVDRLGSVRWRSVERGGQAWQVGGEVLRYRPYGEEVTATGNYRDKFGTYLRDESGFDYADQRYYDSGKGRFLTVDPYEASGGPGEPGSWNRYSSVGGDPVNYADPLGLLATPVEWREYEEASPDSIGFRQSSFDSTWGWDSNGFAPGSIAAFDAGWYGSMGYSVLPGVIAIGTGVVVCTASGACEVLGVVTAGAVVGAGLGYTLGRIFSRPTARDLAPPEAKAMTEYRSDRNDNGDCEPMDPDKNVKWRGSDDSHWHYIEWNQDRDCANHPKFKTGRDPGPNWREIPR